MAGQFPLSVSDDDISSDILTQMSSREAVFPTRMTLGLMKTKLKGAEQGHTLLKRKSEALTKRFRDITKRIDDVSMVELNYFLLVKTY